jgi:osmotically-inducible protein OsmY
MDEIRDHRGKGPKNYQRSSDRIKEDVNDKLSDNWMLDASNIEVDVKGSEVTLNGTVESREDKRRAEDIAEDVSGVTHIQNNLRVSKTEESDVDQAKPYNARARKSEIHHN